MLFRSDVQGYSEVNANFLNTKLRKSFRDMVNIVDREARSVWSTSLVPSKSDFKSGGSGIVTFGRVAPRIKESGTDRMGRWCYQVLEGKGREILLVNVYQVCVQTADGKLTASQQQRIMLSEENREADPRKYFKKDLIQLLRKHKLRNGNIVPILMGDWNKESSRKLFADEVQKEFGLVDAFKRRFPKNEVFKTHIDGSKRIDYVLTLPWVADAMTSIVYEPFCYRMTGDHRGLYFDIDETKLFCDTSEEAYDFSGRILQSKNKKNAGRYLEIGRAHV